MLSVASPPLEYRPIVKYNFITKADWENVTQLVLREVKMKNLLGTRAVYCHTYAMQLTGGIKKQIKNLPEGGHPLRIKYFNSRNIGQKTMAQFASIHFQFGLLYLHKL